jgi:AcrR family transcriptional regulator
MEQRRRGAALEAAILGAAWDELSEVGYQRLTMEGVAARAQTGKQVLYRRWRNRAELVISAVRTRVTPIRSNLPDTGSLREDVLAVTRLMASRYHELGPDVIHGVLMEASDLGSEFYGLLADVMTPLLRRAEARGEIEPDRITPRVAALPLDLTRNELLMRGPVPDAALVEIVDQVFLPLVSPDR